MTSPAPPFPGPAARRPVLLLLPALAAACARTAAPPPPPLPPMGWTHLTPLALDVAGIEVASTAPPPLPGDVGPLLSPPPAEAVRGMARDRLSALGASGEARFLVTAASLVRAPGGGSLQCSLACRLELSGRRGGAAEGPAFVEAAAQRGVSGAEAARPDAAELLLRRTMDDLNVEFEFQVRRALRSWLVAAAPDGGAVPPPVGREDLPRIGQAPAAGGTTAPPEPPLGPPLGAPPSAEPQPLQALPPLEPEE